MAESTADVAPVERWKISPVGAAIALAGAAATIIAVFLPRAESSAFSLGGIEQNTLIQSGDGWPFILFAIAIIGAVYRSYSQGKKSWLVPILAVWIIGMAYYQGTNKDKMTLYRIDPSTGSADYSAPSVKASPGVGIYVAGVGGLLALAGGWQMRRDAEPAAETRPPASPAVAPPPAPPAVSTKNCPDCAETVMAEARVCRFCGYRFATDAEA
jgi:hypothetical protein